MISAATIALVKDRADIVKVVGESISLKRNGRVWKACCPFHKEKTPSFQVDPERGWFHCFGCGEKGNAIDFIMKQDGYTFPEAVRVLCEASGIAVDEDRGHQDRSEADRQKKRRDDLYACNLVAAAWFQQQLREHPQRSSAHAELARRGLTADDEIAERFRLGFAPPGWDELAVHLRAQSVSPVDAQTLGLLLPRKSGGGHYDRFRSRLMFPVLDVQGRVIAFSGRAVGPPDPSSKEPPPKYVNSSESPVYTKGNSLFGLHQARQTIRSEEMAVLVEGNFDVVSLHARGLTNVVAPLGTAFTSDQARALRRFTQTVTVLFDGDGAGRKATRAAREPCEAAGLTARVAVLPDGVDPDDFVRTRGPETMRDLVTAAAGMLEHLVDSALDDSTGMPDVYLRASRIEQIEELLLDEPLVGESTVDVVDRLLRQLR
jgi:DNA primase